MNNSNLMMTSYAVENTKFHLLKHTVKENLFFSEKSIFGVSNKYNLSFQSIGHNHTFAQNIVSIFKNCIKTYPVIRLTFVEN